MIWGWALGWILGCRAVCFPVDFLANFVSMESYNGFLAFEYFGEHKRVAYTMNNLGGSAHIYIQDKHGVHHTFFYRKSEKQWELGGNYKLKWPQDFINVMFAAMDLERERHGL